MTFHEFRGFVEGEPRLAESLKSAAAAAAMETPPKRRYLFDFSSPMVVASALIVFFPIVNRIVRRIGLPWLSSLERYSELWRMEFDWWVDKQYKKRGFDPVAAKAASEALAEELQNTTDAEARRAWERLAALLSKERGKQGNDAGLERRPRSPAREVDHAFALGVDVDIGGNDATGCVAGGSGKIHVGGDCARTRLGDGAVWRWTEGPFSRSPIFVHLWRPALIGIPQDVESREPIAQVG